VPRDEVDALARIVRETMEAALPLDVPLTVDGAEPGSAQEVTIGASVGVAVGGPGEPVDSVLDSADRALYRAKDLGRRRWASAPAHQDPSDGGEARR
jgi:GGDEF domain-containing protein